jgi:hypothetical protein
MRITPLIFILSLLWGCSDNEISYISICNETPLPIYARSYSSDFSDGNWIQPGVIDEFYSLGINDLNGYEYFSVYYDSMIIYVRGYEDDPVKFYSDGTTINYDPALNPFINPEVWITRTFQRHLPGKSTQSLEEKQIYEHYFSIEPGSILSLSESALIESDPAP